MESKRGADEEDENAPFPSELLHLLQPPRKVFHPLTLLMLNNLDQFSSSRFVLRLDSSIDVPRRGREHFVQRREAFFEGRVGHGGDVEDLQVTQGE
jgi:hypothetical protein